jgi:hypothetical protein
VNAAQLVAIVYSGLMLVFFIIFLIGFFRHRKRVRPYTKYALVPAVGLMLIDAAILFASPELLRTLGAPAIGCVDLLAFARMIVFGAVGMYCAALVGCPHMPLLRAALGRRRRIAPGLGAGLLVWSLGLAAAGVVYSWVLFTLVPVRASDAVRQMLENSPASSPISPQPSLLAALVMLEFALAEEVVFRLGIQNYLAKLLKLRGGTCWTAILLSALLWSTGHVNTLDPDWPKLLQVFPFGLALGLLFRRYGLEACILAHAVFNLVLMFLAPSLIEF